MKLQIWGAAGTVTGSRYLLEANKKRILVDCGLFQGEKELRLRNWDEPPFDPASLHGVLLTHAHIDHTGYLPVLIKRGFRGPIWGSRPTLELVRLLLLDSARLQEEEALWRGEKGFSKHHPPKPLYDEQDAVKVFDHLRALISGEEIFPGVRVTSADSGHILGSNILNVEAEGRRVTFSGDVGRFHAPLLKDPQPVELGDLLLCETTYGNREHPEENFDHALRTVVLDAMRLGGPLIIPAFALGRTQTLLYVLAELERNGQLPPMRVFVDSPMASEATMIYQNHSGEHDEEATALAEKGRQALRTLRTQFCRTTAQSKELNGMKGFRVIISASGMATGGRVLHHLRQHLPDPKATILFVGYQAKGTRGEIIQSGAEEVRIFGQPVMIRASRVTVPGLSAHADRKELVRWLRSCTGAPRKIRLVHGEPDAAKGFQDYLQQEMRWSSEAATHGEEIEV